MTHFQWGNGRQRRTALAPWELLQYADWRSAAKVPLHIAIEMDCQTCGPLPPVDAQIEAFAAPCTFSLLQFVLEAVKCCASFAEESLCVLACLARTTRGV